MGTGHALLNWVQGRLRRVPVVIRSKYLEKIFEGFPVLMVNDFTEVTAELLENNDHLYQQALNLDMSKLDIKVIYDNIISEVEEKIRMARCKP